MVKNIHIINGTNINMYRKASIDLLFKLIREELWQSSVCVDDKIKSFSEVMKLAGEQCVQGLVINSLFRRNTDIGKDNVFKCISLKRQIEKSNQRLNGALEKLAAILNRHNIKYVVFKGQTVAAYYPLWVANIGRYRFLLRRLRLSEGTESNKKGIGSCV